jgi:hypothetical protein
MAGRIKRKPRYEGKRSVGMTAKSRESELASPKAEAMDGPVRRKVRSVEGAVNARRGCSAVWVLKGWV